MPRVCCRTYRRKWIFSKNGNEKDSKTMRSETLLRSREKKKYNKGERYVQKIIHRMAEAPGFHDP